MTKQVCGWNTLIAKNNSPAVNTQQKLTNKSFVPYRTPSIETWQPPSPEANPGIRHWLITSSSDKYLPAIFHVLIRQFQVEQGSSRSEGGTKPWGENHSFSSADKTKNTSHMRHGVEQRPKNGDRLTWIQKWKLNILEIRDSWQKIIIFIGLLAKKNQIVFISGIMVGKWTWTHSHMCH